MLSALHQMGIVAILSLLVGIAPAFMAVAYAIRPSEARLALMRPVSLASIFAALCGSLAGLVNILRFVAVEEVPITSRVALIGLSEALVPMFVAFGCLTITWLLVAVGLRRHGHP